MNGENKEVYYDVDVTLIEGWNLITTGGKSERVQNLRRVRIGTYTSPEEANRIANGWVLDGGAANVKVNIRRY